MRMPELLLTHTILMFEEAIGRYKKRQALETNPEAIAYMQKCIQNFEAQIKLLEASSGHDGFRVPEEDHTKPELGYFLDPDGVADVGGDLE